MSRRKLLLADDSITIQKVVNLTFADEGIDVTTVGDGDAALAHLGGVTPDIVLADVNMPGPTGYQICEQLRASDATKNVPVILLVGSFEPFDETEAARVGANAYLTKPFQSIKQLIAQVNELIDASKPTTAELSTAAPVAAGESTQPAASSEPVAEESQQPEPIETADTIEDIEIVETSESGSTVQAVETTPRYFDDLGYETSVQPPAPAAQPLDDIDDLYTQSMDRGQDDFSDVGIDDEMIETSYTAADMDNDLGSFAVSTDDVAVEEPAQEVAVPDYTTSQLSAEPEHAAPAAESAAPVEQVQQDSSMDTVEYHNWRPADMRDEPVQTNPYETAPLQTPHVVQEVSEEVAPVSSEAPYQETTEAHAHDASAEPTPFVEPKVGEDTIKIEGQFDSTGSSFKFDDVDLLDLSAGAGQPVEITSPSNAVEQGSSKQIVTLSPELIEMIAQRVVEKMSEKY